MSAFPLLTRRCSHEMFARLIAMLPPARDPSVEALLERDATAYAAIAALGRILSVEEASLAITVVAADVHAHDALRSASENQGDVKLVMQCRSQAMAMLRTRRQAVERLERLQAQHPVEQAATKPAPDVQSRTEAGSPTPPPTPEERARKRVMMKALYARMAGLPVPSASEARDHDVRSSVPDAAVIAAIPAPSAWRPAA